MGRIALIVGIYLLGRLGPQLGPVRVETHGDVAGREGRALIDLTLLMFVIALFRLSNAGRGCRGPLFGPRVTQSFRGFAFWLFLATLVDVIAGPAIAIAQKIMGAGPGCADVRASRRADVAGTCSCSSSPDDGASPAIESELEEIV
jgi:hypothetical protein